MQSDDTVAEHNVVVPEGSHGLDRAGRAGSWASRITSSLTLPDFRTLWLSSTGGFLAMQMQTVAQGYLAYAITGSAMALGAVSIAWGAALLPLALFGGAIADRVDKRNLILGTQSLAFLSSLGIAILVATGQIALWHLIAASVLQGVVFAFNMPARQAMMPELVGKSLLNNAIALVSIGNNISRIIGPAIAGALLAIDFIGISGTYFVIAGVSALIVLISSRLPSVRPSYSEGTIDKKEPLTASIVSGLTFLRGSPFLMTALASAFVPVILGMPYQSLLPVFNEQVLAESVEVLGLLYTAIGVGSLVGSFSIATIKNAHQRTTMQVTIGVMFGISLAVFGLMRDYRAALVLLFFIGICNQSFLTMNNMVIMANTPREYYGRVMSIYQLTFAAMPIGTFPISALADSIGIAPTLVIDGSVLALLMLAVLALNPHARVNAHRSALALQEPEE